MITRWVLPLSLQCLDGNNFLQKRATRAAGHMFMWQLRLHNLKSHMIFFFPPFLWNWQLAVYRLPTTMKAAKLFHPSVFTPTIFPSLYYDYDFAAVTVSLPCLKNHLPALVGPAVPQMCHGGCPTTGRGFQTGNGFICCWTRQGITILPLASVPALAPQSWTWNCWQPASHRVETMGLSILKELFFWSSTDFSRVQESCKLCVYLLYHCSQWFAVFKYVCAGSMDSPIIFIASYRKLLFPSRD